MQWQWVGDGLRDDSHSRLKRACATRLLGASYLFHVFGMCQKRENSSTWTCQKREIERQHKNVAATVIFSMLALRPKRGRKERGEERKRKRGEARISFDLPFRYFYPAHTVLASNAIQWRQTQK